MVMTVTESTGHELQLIVYMTFLLSIAQFMVRVFNLNGLFTMFVLAAGFTYISTQYQRDLINPLTIAHSLFRAAADIIGFLAGITGFLSLLVVSGTTELVFTPEALLTLLSGGGLSVSHVFLTMGLTYASNMSLFSASRLLVNIGRIPFKLFEGAPNNNNINNAAAEVEPDPEPVAEVAPVAVARRGRGRPRRNN